MGQYYHAVNIDKQEFTKGDFLKLMETSYIGNHFVNGVCMAISKYGNWFKNRIVWAGDYADNEPDSDENLYQIVKNKVNFEVENIDNKLKLRYLKSIDKSEFIDLNKHPDSENIWTLHPLPFMVCEGNGQGGGDYWGEDKQELVGRWARNKVVFQKSKPKNCTEINFDLAEK